MIGDESPVDVVEEWLGDIGITGRPTIAGEGGLDRLDEDGVDKDASSFMRALKSPVDRFILSG